MLDVETTQTMDTAGIARRLTRDERKVVRSFASVLKDFYAREWTDWKYEGRPQGAPRNVSLAAWKVKVETTEGAFLKVTNNARDYRTKQSYVADVRRSGQSEPEASRLQTVIERDLLPGFVNDLADAIAKNAALPAKPQKRRSQGGATVRAAGLEL